MSSTRIDGFVFVNNIPTESGDRLRDVTVTFFPEEDPSPKMTKTATLIIGGKALTEEEHEAALVKTREVVQALVDACALQFEDVIEVCHCSICMAQKAAISLAKSLLQIEPTKP